MSSNCRPMLTPLLTYVFYPAPLKKNNGVVGGDLSLEWWRYNPLMCNLFSLGFNNSSWLMNKPVQKKVSFVISMHMPRLALQNNLIFIQCMVCLPTLINKFTFPTYGTKVYNHSWFFLDFKCLLNYIHTKQFFSTIRLFFSILTDCPRASFQGFAKALQRL